MAVIPTGRVLLNAKALLTKAGLSLGMTYADFGAGALGHFVLPATEMVGREGTVYAVDILKSVLQAIGSRARMEGANNLKTVWGNIEKMRGVKISDHSVDLLSCVNIVNLLDKSAGVISEISRVLVPGGLYLFRENGSPRHQDADRQIRVAYFTKEELEKMVDESGFQILEGDQPIESGDDPERVGGKKIAWETILKKVRK